MMMGKRALVVWVMVSSLSGGALAQDKGASLSSVEQQLVARINEQLPQAQALLTTAVNINSGTMNFKGVRLVGTLFQQQFSQLGFKTKWLPGDKFGRAGHLQASFEGKDSANAPKILLIGHLDTVFSKNDPLQRATQVDDQHIAGPGITDMKGGDVIIIAILQALKYQGLLERFNLQVVMTGDEELSGKPLALSKKAIIDGGIWADIALGFEDGDGDVRTAVASRRGSVHWSLEVTGKPAHSSQIFSEQNGYGAIFETARILNGFRLELMDEKLLTFNPGLLAGGSKVENDKINSTVTAYGKDNIIAQTSRVTGDIRAISPQQLARSQSKMQEIAAKNLLHTSAVLTFDRGYPPMAQSQGNLALLAKYSQVSVDLGFGPVLAVDPLRAGAADISFAAAHVNMALDGLGLMGSGGHTKDEVADMTSFGQNMQKSALLLYRLSTQPEDK
ncbi:MAG: glutamate carboxypeptidase [Paraglaciecola sp.]|jgi:glutamate carboxypeptidase